MVDFVTRSVNSAQLSASIFTTSPVPCRATQKAGRSTPLAETAGIYWRAIGWGRVFRLLTIQEGVQIRYINVRFHQSIRNPTKMAKTLWHDFFASRCANS